MKLRLTAFLLSLLLIGGVSAYAKEVSFAFVDVAKIFDEYEKTKDNDRVLQEQGRQKEEERDAIVHEVRQLKDELVLLSEEAREERRSELEGKIKELQSFDEDTKRALGGQRREVVREIFADIDDTVQRYGERKGIDFVFSERTLLYHNKSYDVTKEILDELNKAYQKKK